MIDKVVSEILSTPVTNSKARYWKLFIRNMSC